MNTDKAHQVLQAWYTDSMAHRHVDEYFQELCEALEFTPQRPTLSPPRELTQEELKLKEKMRKYIERTKEVERTSAEIAVIKKRIKELDIERLELDTERSRILRECWKEV